MVPMLIAATLLFLVFAPFIAWPMEGYRVREVTPPGAVQSRVVGFSNRGDVVGEADGGWFVKFGSRYQPFEIEADWFHPMDLNNRRYIVGEYQRPDGVYTSFEHIGATRKHRTTVTLHYPDSAGTSVTGMNDRGDIVGRYHDGTVHPSGDPAWTPFVLSGEDFTVLPPVEGAEVYAEDINNAGDIVGTVYHMSTGLMHGFVLIDWQYHFFGDHISTATGINDHGHVVGSFYNPETDGWHGYLYKDGTFTTINVGEQTTLVRINNQGHLAGTYYGPEDAYLSHGFVAVPKRARLVRK
jgi:probable HAF family extracellular repeat protein